ncbi:Gfo/Idh/MocA family protein [Parendozoicomonas haliclonae]|uniref:1,5-anhydro-D-fructose reductase n=1 Tax=Parendozoicomonas haliclonae TaxID=1960125 RepID=A0A1X7AFN6_9GAMM|nr:Gfo/Idh/MocA family oxidoreductase [Parendozoicomonas haliclonae]SMA37881.1 1,5-anhydro-D-fructose reductase [Parendozoicomonas haliclonae]
MIRFAVVGTNWISHAFCEAAQESGRLELVAVYSRTLETAQTFADEYGVSRVYDDLDEIAGQPDIDAVYIASPNSLHAPQASLFIRQGKHVIVEKPMASNLAETEALIALAKEHGVVLLEAMKSRYTPNLVRAKEVLATLGPLHRASLSYCQYSSRYQRYLDGKNPNTFNPEFSNGSLMDIGVYPLSAALELFGIPKSFTASGQLLDSGVDAHGSLTLKYDTFEVLLSHSKVSDSYLPSEIQCENGSLMIESISRFKQLTVHERGLPERNVSLHQSDNEMVYEAHHFADLIEQGNYDHEGLEKTREVSRILTEARAQLGITYPADAL